MIQDVTLQWFVVACKSYNRPQQQREGADKLIDLVRVAASLAGLPLSKYCWNIGWGRLEDYLVLKALTLE